MNEERHVIWTNDLDYDDWKADLEDAYPDLSDDERHLLMYEANGDYLDDERANLNIQLSQPILVITDLGLWNGHRSAYREINSGNIRDCLYSERDIDYSTWYVDKQGDLRCEAVHHDGTNSLLYRTYKDGSTEEQRDHLLAKIYTGTATRADIDRVTSRLGDEIGKVYGWDFPREKTEKEYEKGDDTMSRRKDAMTETYERVTVLGQPMLFSSLRIDCGTVPKGMYLYEVRHDDDQRGDPVQIGQWILVNHWGTLISNKPIKLEPSSTLSNNAYRDIDPENDWNYEGVGMSLKEYMAEFPPEKPKRIEHER